MAENQPAQKNRMNSRKKLSEFGERLRHAMQEWPGTLKGGHQAFDELALELFALQFELNEPYCRLCKARWRSPETVEHWSAIPAVPAASFKEWELSCLSEDERTAVFYSSGTTVQSPSRHFHSAESLAVYEASLLGGFSGLGAPASPLAKSKNRTLVGEDAGAPRLAILTPSREEAPNSSLVYMFDTIRRNLGAPESVFLGQCDEDGTWSLDRKRALELLRGSVVAESPVLLLGTAFSFVHLLDDLAEQNLIMHLPPGSIVLETGGYKGRSRSLPKAELYSCITKQLAIPNHGIISEYGMSELSSQAYDGRASGEGRGARSEHVSHITHHTPTLSRSHALTLQPRPCSFPPWARAQVISAETGREVADGETGLIRVFDLANVFSVMAIQTEDLAIRRGSGFELIGRAELAEARGCSLMASEQ